MKRKELEKKLRMAGCYLKREGSSHSLWINPQTGVTEAVPRHTEIKEFLSKNSQKLECLMASSILRVRSVLGWVRCASTFENSVEIALLCHK